MPRGSRRATACSNGGTTGSSLMDVLAGGLGNVADTVIACLDRADRRSLGLACKALQDEVASRWRYLIFEEGMPAELLRSKLLPKLRGVEELWIKRVADLDALQGFYRLLLALKRNGARVKAIESTTKGPLLLPRRSARLAAQLPAEQPHEWVLTADSLQQLQPFPYLEQLCLWCDSAMDAALLQPLLRAPALKIVELNKIGLVTGSSLDLSACSQLQELELWANRMDITACLRGLQPVLGLKKLALTGFVARSQWLQHISRSWPQLERLGLAHCQLLDPDAAAQHAPQQPSFPSLKELRLVCGIWADPSDSALRELFETATRLQRLLLDCVGPDIPVLPLDSSGLAHLEELEIAQDLVPRGALIALLGQLARNQRRLRKLKIEHRCLQGVQQQAGDELTTQDIQTFLDAAPPCLELMRLRGTEHVQQALLVLPAAAVGCQLDISPLNPLLTDRFV